MTLSIRLVPKCLMNMCFEEAITKLRSVSMENMWADLKQVCARETAGHKKCLTKVIQLIPMTR